MRYLIVFIISSYVVCKNNQVDVNTGHSRNLGYEQKYKQYLEDQKKKRQKVHESQARIRKMDIKQKEKEMKHDLDVEDHQDEQEEQMFEQENIVNFKTQSILSQQQVKYIQKMDGDTSKYNIQLESDDNEHLYFMVKKVPDDIKVLIMILGNEDSRVKNNLQVQILDAQKEELKFYKNKDNYYIHFQAIEKGEYQIIIKNKGQYKVNLMIMSQQDHSLRDIQKIDKLYAELQTHLQNETYALSTSTQVDISQYLLKNSIKKLKKANSIDTFIEKKIQIKADSIEKIDYKFMVFAVLECLAIIACTIIQLQIIKGMFRGRSIL